jgi:hypothetical protein
MGTLTNSALEWMSFLCWEWILGLRLLVRRTAAHITRAWRDIGNMATGDLTSECQLRGVVC